MTDDKPTPNESALSPEEAERLAARFVPLWEMPQGDAGTDRVSSPREEASTTGAGLPMADGASNSQSTSDPGRASDPGRRSAPPRLSDPGRPSDPGRRSDPGRPSDPGRRSDPGGAPRPSNPGSRATAADLPLLEDTSRPSDPFFDGDATNPRAPLIEEGAFHGLDRTIKLEQPIPNILRLN